MMGKIKGLLLLAVCVFTFYGCEQSELQTPLPAEQTESKTLSQEQQETLFADVLEFSEQEKTAVLEAFDKRASDTSKDPAVGECNLDDFSCGGGGGGNGTQLRYVRVDTYTDHYNVRPNGVLDYNGSTFTGSRYEYQRVNSTSPLHRHIQAPNTPHGSRSYTPNSAEIAISSYPSCKSFDFSKVGNTGVQVAAVDGIHETVVRTNECPGIGIALSYQTYYFYLPSYLSKGQAATRAAEALGAAFYDMERWFERQPCNQLMVNQLAAKMDEYIRDNMRQKGGQASRYAPNGWDGNTREYFPDLDGTDVCY